MEKRKQKRNINSIMRAQERLKRKTTEDFSENKQEIIKKKIMDLYKMGNIFNKRSRSCMDLRTAIIQTEPNQEFEKEFKAIGEVDQHHQQKLSLDKKRQSRLSIFGELDINRTQKNFEKIKNKLAEQNQKSKKIVKTEKKFEKEKFQAFVTDATKYMEKLLIDEKVKDEQIFVPPVQVKDKIVSHLEWSDLIPEVFLTIHLDKNDNPSNKTNENDQFFIWNREFPTRPEYELNSKSKVESAIFSQFQSEIIISGCKNGSIQIYDLRASQSPIQVSNPSIDAHRTPIYNIIQVGGRNSNNIVSISEEGRLCIWQLSNIDKPLKKIDLMVPIDPDVKNDNDFNLEPYSLSCIKGDTTGVFVGTNDKNVYKYKILTGGTFQNDVNTTLSFKSHRSIVNTMDHKQNSNFSSLLSGMMLTGSFDWNVKIWNPRSTDCLYTFEHHQNPITCVHWNPVHPAMFASSDSSGKVKVMNLFKSFKDPVYSKDYKGTVFNSKWNRNGNCLAVTDEQGNTIIKKFNQEFLDFQPKNIKNFEKNIKKQIITLNNCFF